MKKNILVLALSLGLTSFVIDSHAQTIEAAITTSGYSGLVSFNLNGTTNEIVTTGLALPTNPTALAFDSYGNLFIGSGGGNIRQMTTNGNVSYFSTNYAGIKINDGVNALAFNPKNGQLFAAITTSVYSGLVSFNLNGTTNEIVTTGLALPNNPTALAFDSYGDLFIGSAGGNIRQMTPNGNVSYFSTNYAGIQINDGVNALAFNSKNGQLFAAITTSVYSGLVSFNLNGTTNEIVTTGLALPNNPTALAFDSYGDLFIGSAGGNIREMTPNGNVSYFSTNYSGIQTNDGVNALAFNPNGTASIPEPSTYALFGIGAIGLLMVIRRKKAV